MRVRLALRQKKGVQANRDRRSIRKKQSPCMVLRSNDRQRGVPPTPSRRQLVGVGWFICGIWTEVFCSPERRLLSQRILCPRPKRVLWVKFADDRLYARTEALTSTTFDRSHHANNYLRSLADSLRVVEREAFAGVMREGTLWLGARIQPRRPSPSTPGLNRCASLGQVFWRFHIPDECHRLPGVEGSGCGARDQ